MLKGRICGLEMVHFRRNVRCVLAIRNLAVERKRHEYGTTLKCEQMWISVLSIPFETTILGKPSLANNTNMEARLARIDVRRTMLEVLGKSRMVPFRRRNRL